MVLGKHRLWTSPHGRAPRLPCPAARTPPAGPTAPASSRPELTHVFVWVGVLGLRGVGDGSVTVRAVVLAVIVGRPVV